MDERAIRIELAGRAYPLTISASEEVNVRRAVDEINESINRLKASYPLTDKQDLLAMAALEVTVRALNSAAAEQDHAVQELLTALERTLSEVRS
ncbi:MAG: cell division protein ZapA [Flavobacteriales bacterium]|jgi:cell division protein ZapA|nr:cell division protein ZapA [Flavobacteriales bacterium]